MHISPCYLQQMCSTNLHICLQPPVSGYLPSPPGSVAVLPAVYWARCSLHHQAVRHHRKGQQQSHEAIHKYTSYIITHIHTIYILFGLSGNPGQTSGQKYCDSASD